jgi:outer membrane receptor for monomeric catechols
MKTLSSRSSPAFSMTTQAHLRGLPPQLTLNATSYSLPRDFSVGDPSYDDSSRNVVNLGYELEHRLNETWTFRQNARYTNQRWDYTALGMASTGLAKDGRTINRTATVQNERLNTFNIDNNLVAEFDTGPVENTNSLLASTTATLTTMLAPSSGARRHSTPSTLFMAARSSI